MMTKIHAKPKVSGTNKKWYITVIANCSRDNSTKSIMMLLCG
jgi:hypothetical protein